MRTSMSRWMGRSAAGAFAFLVMTLGTGTAQAQFFGTGVTVSVGNPYYGGGVVVGGPAYYPTTMAVVDPYVTTVATVPTAYAVPAPWPVVTTSRVVVASPVPTLTVAPRVYVPTARIYGGPMIATPVVAPLFPTRAIAYPWP